jgi:hypothetical protein
LQTSFAEAGRRSTGIACSGGVTITDPVPLKAKAIPHGLFHHNDMYLTIVKYFHCGNYRTPVKIARDRAGRASLPVAAII